MSNFSYCYCRTSNTAFNQLMQNIELIPVFGTSFAVYIPLIMLIVALLTLFDGFGRIVKILGIEREDTSSDSHNGLSCTCRNRDKEMELDPQMQEKIRTGKLIVTNEIKQRRANDYLSGNNRTPTSSSLGSNGDLSNKKSNIMRIGAPSSVHLKMTEALIPSNTTYNPTYRNIIASADTDADLDLDLSDHQLGYAGSSTRGTGYGRVSSDRGVELNRPGVNAADTAARNSLFGFSGTSSSSNRSGGSPTTAISRRPTTDLFSINNDEAANLYAGRYSDV